MTRSNTFVTLVLALVVSGGVVGGCKGETVYKPDPNTQSDLDKCKHDKDDLEAYKKKLEAENAELIQRGSGGEIVVTIDGDLVKPIKGSFGGGGGDGTNMGPPADPKSAIAFQNLVERSRGAIQKCYEQVLKKDANLQARTIRLTVSASFTSTGAYQQASFSPSTPLGTGFDSCMQGIATHWTLPTNSPAMTFKAQVSLTPS
jgi:hypothetical protein